MIKDFSRIKELWRFLSFDLIQDKRGDYKPKMAPSSFDGLRRDRLRHKKLTTVEEFYLTYFIDLYSLIYN
jgi:hypothetical protein